MRSFRLSACLFSGLVIVAATSATTAAISFSIANPSFESPIFGDGGYDFLVPPDQQGAWGWDIDDGGFIYNPLASDYTGGGANGTPTGGDGAQVAGLYQFGDYSVAQLLAGADMIPGNADDPLVEEGTIYTLTLAIGQRALGNPISTWGGYDIQLRADRKNGPLLGQETNVITPPPGTFQTRTLTIACPTFTQPELAGHPLVIVLRKPTESSTATVDYDNVQLTATKISPIKNPNFNELGSVDGADLAIWKANLGANCLDATHNRGNANGDDYVNGADFLAWQRQLGTPAISTAVPEPAAHLLAAGAALIASRRRPK